MSVGILSTCNQKPLTGDFRRKKRGPQQDGPRKKGVYNHKQNTAEDRGLTSTLILHQNAPGAFFILKLNICPLYQLKRVRNDHRRVFDPIRLIPQEHTRYNNAWNVSIPYFFTADNYLRTVLI